MSSTAPISVQNLQKTFKDNKVLKGVSLQIEPGDLAVVIGPSGCGKSTFLRCLNGLEIADEGKITIGGLTLDYTGNGNSQNVNIQKLRSTVGMVFQSFNLFPHLTVLDNIALSPVVVKNQPRSEVETLARDLLKKVGLSTHENHYPSQLSGGQQQRTAIARALAMTPSVMLYDEPTSALDPSLVDEVLQVMKQLDAEGMTQIVVTHEMRFAREAADKIFFLDEGVLVESGPAEQIFTNPKDERTRKFLKKFL